MWHKGLTAWVMLLLLALVLFGHTVAEAQEDCPTPTPTPPDAIEQAFLDEDWLTLIGNIVIQDSDWYEVSDCISFLQLYQSYMDDGETLDAIYYMARYYEECRPSVMD